MSAGPAIWPSWSWWRWRALGAWRLQGVGLKDYSAYRALYAALVSTPKDALIAGHPNLMDTIPTFARRRAFATYELAHPWSLGYWGPT